MLEVVCRNANEVCRCVILGLPLVPPPTLNTIIEARMKKAYVEPKATPTRGSGFKQRTAAMAATSPRPPKSPWLSQVKCLKYRREVV